MKIMVLGGGGREHALLWKLSQSRSVSRLYAAPGNGGTSTFAPSVPISLSDHDKLADFIQKQGIDLTVAGPEAPLVAGVGNVLAARGLAFCGPTKQGARLEGSKAWSKGFMERHGIPTAPGRVFDDAAAARSWVGKRPLPLVVKADGLAAGKGALIARTRKEAAAAVEALMVRQEVGKAGKVVLVEDCLEGEELSLLALTDGADFFMLPTSQDHKRIGEGDTGRNTGGMGAYAPAPLYDRELAGVVRERIVVPTMEGLGEEGIDYRGVIYFGLMVTDKGPELLEYNCRFGDPEAQVVLPLMREDLASVLLAVATGSLKEWREDAAGRESAEGTGSDLRAALCVVLASGGYPGAYETGFPIEGLPEASSSPGVVLFHAGTSLDQRGRILTAGGRVLGVTGTGEDLREAATRAYGALRPIAFPGVYYRRDIGARALGEVPSGA